MVTPSVLDKFYDGLEKSLRAAGFIAGKSGRHMKFPYTFSAKIAQFPLFYYMKKNWIWMYYPVSCVISFYFISKIHFTVNSPEAVRNWEESQRKVAEKEHH